MPLIQLIYQQYIYIIVVLSKIPLSLMLSTIQKLHMHELNECHAIDRNNFPFSRHLEEMNNIGSFQKGVFQSQHILWHFSLLPLACMNPTDFFFLGRCNGCHGKNYINWLPLVDVLSNSLPHWGFGIEHLTFCFSKNMFSAASAENGKVFEMSNMLSK